MGRITEKSQNIQIQSVQWLQPMIIDISGLWILSEEIPQI